MKAVSALLIFIVFLMVVAVAAVATAAFFMMYSPPQIVGSLCTYDTFDGSCNVTSVSGGNVKFKFAPDSAMDLRNASWIGPASDVTKKEYSESLSVIGARCGGECAAGFVLRCRMSIIKTGACTPVLFKFG